MVASQPVLSEQPTLSQLPPAQRDPPAQGGTSFTEQPGQAGSSGRVNAFSGPLNPGCPTPPLCQGPPHPPLPATSCPAGAAQCQSGRRSTLPDAQRGPFCHREHRGSGLSPWKTGPQRLWPRQRNAWLRSSPMSMALVLRIQRVVRKRSLRGGERQPGLGCTLGSLLSGQPSPAPGVLPAPSPDSGTCLPRETVSGSPQTVLVQKRGGHRAAPEPLKHGASV